MNNMERDLTVSSSFNYAGFIAAIVMWLIGFYVFLRDLSIVSVFFILVLGAVIVIMLLVARDQIRLTATEGGTAESIIWTFTGRKKYRYKGLSKAKEIVLIDISGDTGPMFKQYLKFEDGYELPLPEGKDVVNKIINWFESCYRITLSVNKK